MTEDPDLIARLYPAHVAGHARDLIEDHPWCVGGGEQPQLDSQSRTSRESTEEYQQSDDGGSLPYIELRFSHLTKGSSGFVFGRDKATCDIVLPSLSGISRTHFALTFKNTFADGRYRLVVRDLGSTSGTEVKYQWHSEGKQSKFDWVVSGTSISAQALFINILPQKWLEFYLVVAHHDLDSPAYIANVEKFCMGAVSTEDFGGPYVPGTRWC